MNDELELRHRLIGRIFVLQVILILVATVQIPVAIIFELGWFWSAFLAGIFGASISMLRRLNRSEEIPAFLQNDSWIQTLSPHLYGGLMAGVAYFLMFSGIVSGMEGSGIITSNLFPSFTKSLSTNGVAMADFLVVRPQTLTDASKLVVWCFIAGYSESFVTGILRGLEGHGTSNAD